MSQDNAADTAGELVVVVPVHDPGDGLLDLVSALGSQVSRVVLVDDGSTEAGAGAILSRCGELGATVLRHDSNRGIAAALNTGITEAMASAPYAVLTLDQDSAVGPDFVATLLGALVMAQAAGLRVGLVAPERVTGIPSQATAYANGFALGRDPVQSGLLLPRATIEQVGGFDESLFIDGVDADYALRCLDAGLRVVVALGAILDHRLGATHELRVAGHRLALVRSAPFRYYYLARNRSRLIRRHGRRHPAWAAGQVVGLAGHLVLTLALAPDRRVRARETLAGIRDAARGVSGPRPSTRRG